MDIPYKNCKNEKSEYKFLTFLAMMFLCILIITEMTVFLTINFYQYKIPIPALIIPFLYSMADLIAEVYGYREVKKIIWNGLLVQLLFGVFFAFITKVRFIDFSENIILYKSIFDNILKINLVGYLSLIPGMFLNAIIISKLKLNMMGKKYWFRTVISSCISGFIATFIACNFLFFGSISYTKIIELSAIILLYKITFAILVSPVLSYVTKKVKQVEDIDKYDYKINYNPFRF